MIVYLDGQWLDAQHASIPIDDRGFLLADGVFETARLSNGRFFRLQQHIERLHESACQLQLTAPPAAELRMIFSEVARRNDLTDGSLRITITRGSGGRGLDTRGAGPERVLVTIAPMPSDWRERAARGWSVIIARTRRPSIDSVPAQLKALGRVYALLAHLEAEAAGADDALLLTAAGDIAEGPTWNFFWRKGRILRTAALEGGILEGVTRGIVLTLARAEGYQTEEGLWFPADLADADEAFASMTSIGVVPIVSIDGRQLGSRDCARLLDQRYWQFVEADEG